MSLIHNERTKLTATYVNGSAIAMLAVGGLAPVVNAMVSANGVTIGASITAVLCISVSVALHFMARRILKGLEP